MMSIRWRPAAAGAAALLAGAASAAGALNEIYVDFAVKAERPPVLDGRLDDAVWGDAVVHTRFYEYFKPRPKSAAIRSEMRLLYTDKALWIGLVHHENRVDALKTLATVRDGVSWWEDMSELYIDPFGAAVGYTKLLVNSAGVIGDRRRIDGSVKLWEWSGDAWSAKTSVGKDRWTIELCLPFSDLQMPPVPGKSMWRLCVTRYQWTSGGFVGSVSSPGGNNKNTAGFGYLWFLPPGERPDVAGLSKIMAGRVAAPWCTEIGGSMVYDFGEGIRRESLSSLVARKRREVGAELARVRAEVRPGALETEYAEIAASCDASAAEGPTLAGCMAADDALAKIRTFYWKVRLANEFGGEK